MGELSGKIALVTGASRGIGRAMALMLAREGAHVIASARTVGGLEELDDEIRKAGGAATLVPLDIKDSEGVDRLGAAIFERWQKLDVLVGNAGILGKLSPIGHIDPSVWADVMATNVTANWRLIRSMDPLLRQARAARAVFLTSGAAVNFRAYWGAYSVSKAGLEALVKTYAAETATTPLRVNLLNPGPIATKMRAAAMPGEDAATLPSPDALAQAALPLFLDAVDVTGEVFNFQRDTGKLAQR
jgi:NAD(P)-dependent dehydrogenase (short-subunit alcohol dehydrogenase family)